MDVIVGYLSAAMSRSILGKSLQIPRTWVFHAAVLPMQVAQLRKHGALCCKRGVLPGIGVPCDIDHCIQVLGYSVGFPCPTTLLNYKVEPQAVVNAGVLPTL